MVFVITLDIEHYVAGSFLSLQLLDVTGSGQASHATLKGDPDQCRIAGWSTSRIRWGFRAGVLERKHWLGADDS